MGDVGTRTWCFRCSSVQGQCQKIGMISLMELRIDWGAIQHIGNNIPTDSRFAYWYKSFRESDTQLFTIILSNFKEKQLPPNSVLNGIDSVLTHAYDQHSTMMGSLDHVLHVLIVLRDHIVTLTPKDVMNILVKLHGGRALRIGDKMEVIAVDAFNSVVRWGCGRFIRVTLKISLSTSTPSIAQLNWSIMRVTVSTQRTSSLINRTTSFMLSMWINLLIATRAY